MANWGAFAGGLTRGYLAGEEMQQTQKRTALMADEVEMRKQEAARRAEEAAFQKKQRDALEAFRTEYAAVIPTLPYATGPDGKPDFDPTNPQNARANTMAYGHSYRLRVKHGLTNPKEDADFLSIQQELAGKDRQQAAAQFILTGDASHLEKFDPSFKGAKIVVDKGPKGESFEFLQMADGTKHSMDKIYAILPGGKAVLDSKDKTEDNKLQAARDAETARHNKALEARMAAAQGEKPTKEDKELDKVFSTYKPTLPAAFKDTMTNKVPSDDRGELIARDLARNMMKSEKISAGEATKRALAVLDAVNEKTLALMGKSRDPDEFQRKRMFVIDEMSKGGPMGPPSSAANPVQPKNRRQAIATSQAAMDAGANPAGTVQNPLTGAPQR